MVCLRTMGVDTLHKWDTEDIIIIIIIIIIITRDIEILQQENRLYVL